MKIEELGEGLLISDGLEQWVISVELEWERDSGHGGGSYIVEAKLNVTKVKM